VGRKLARQLTRREKAQAGWEENKRRMTEYAEIEEPAPKQQEVPRLEPKNNRQKNAQAYLNTGTPVVILSGSAGTGKSLLAAHRIAQLLKAKKIDKVWLARPAVAVGKSIGMLPGDVKEKLLPYFRQTLDHLAKFLGKGPLDYYVNKGVVEMVPMEYIRGFSFEHCFVLVEESQNMTDDDFEMMLTRMGENSQICFTGDTRQNDLRNQESGLKTTIEFVERLLQTHPEYMLREDIDALDEGFGIVKFLPEDVVRSGLTRSLVKAYYHR
jgi:phosphate starvation-inducible PhoH-like protein